MAEFWWRPKGRVKTVPVDEVNPLPVQTQGEPRYVAVDFAALTVDNTADGVTLPQVRRARCGLRGKIVGRLETAQIRFRVDGHAPSTTVGTLLEVGETLEIVGYADLERFRAIRTGGSSGTLQVTYFIEE